MRREIRITGLGGQGAITITRVLGRAASLYDDKEVAVTEDYSPYITGGWSRGDIVISEESIDYPRISSLDGLLTMYQNGLDSNAAMVKPKGVIVAERRLVDSSRDGPGKKILYLPAMATAEGLGRKVLMNVVLLGSLVATTSAVSVESIQRAVTEEFPKFSELNLRALNAGFDLAKNYDHEVRPHPRSL
jgi:2-oxoglutarate ferredoxin oxidoreductase subunit gamma